MRDIFSKIAVNVKEIKKELPNMAKKNGDARSP
jgi:hypothetical protein